MNNSKVERRMQLAIQMAYKAPRQKYRVGCVIFRRNRPVGFGCNWMHRTHPRAVKHPYGHLHAEVHALLGVSAQDLQNSVAYVARVRYSPGLGISRPCPSCMEALSKAGVKGVFFVDENGMTKYEEVA